MSDAVQRLAAARAGSREALGQILQACRGYLLLLAERELAPDLRAKGGASDLVQETFLEAQKDFAHFQVQVERLPSRSTSNTSPEPSSFTTSTPMPPISLSKRRRR